MEISSDYAAMHAGGSINSNNGFNFFQDRSTHHHVHNHQGQPGIPMPAKSQLRCPLPSPKFVGRKVELRRLEEFFASSELDQKRFALIGMGGCGKSQIAAEFTHSFILKSKIYNPSMVFYIDGTSTSTLEESYASIAQSKGVGLTAKDALLWLSNIQEHSFILIDNVDSAAIDLAAYMPRTLNAHILITTRLHDKGRQYANTSDAFIDLEALPTADAEELLVRYAMLQHGDMKEASVLVQELHCHALAIAQAGACIAFLHLTVSEYLEHFRRLGTSLMDGKNDGVDSSSLHGYSQVVRNTWELSYDQLPESSKDLFSLCAFLHHTGISQAIFQRATEALKTYKPTVPFSPAEEAAFAVVTKALESCRAKDRSFDVFAFRRCIGPILSLSLMRRDPITGVYSIHCLILDSLQRVVCNHLPTTLLLMLATIYDLDDRASLHHLLPHVNSVTRHYTRESTTHQSQCDPAAAFSFVYSASGQFEEAEKMRLDVLSVRRRLLGEDNPYVLSAMHNLAMSWSDLRRYKEAEKMQMDVLSRRRRVLGEDKPHTVLTMHSLALSIFGLGRHEEAEQMLLDVLSRRRRLQGEDHPDTLAAMNTLAWNWSKLGRHKEAEKIRLDVLSRRRRLLGEEHPNTILTMHSLASSWSNLGRHEEAEEMQRDVLSRRRRLLGEDHPDTIATMDNLAWSWSALGRHEESKEMQLDVLSRRRRLLGEDHEDTVSTMGNLAWSWSNLDRHEEAEKILLDILSRRRRLLGEDHPQTISTMHNLASSWSNLEKHEEAKEMQRDVLSRRRRLLGEDHSDTLSAMDNLTWSWSALGRHEEAEKMQLDLLSRRRRLLGEYHIDTMATMDNLAWSWSALGRYKEAEEMLRDILFQRRRFLSEEHPDTILTMHSLASSLSNLGRYREAEKMQLDVLSRRRHLLGEDHPDTVQIMADLALTFSDLQRHHDAEQLCDEALKRQRHAFGEDHPNTIYFAQRLVWISAHRAASESEQSTEKSSGASSPRTSPGAMGQPMRSTGTRP